MRPIQGAQASRRGAPCLRDHVLPKLIPCVRRQLDLPAVLIVADHLLLLDPLCLVLPFLWWRAPRMARWLATLIAAAALISAVVRTVPGLYERDLAFIALAAPVHLIIAMLAWRPRRVAGFAEKFFS